VSDKICVTIDDATSFELNNDEIVAVVEAVDGEITGPSFERALQDVRDD